MRRQELPQRATTSPTLGGVPGTTNGVLDPATSDTPSETLNPGQYLARIVRADQGILTAAVLLPNTTDLKGTAYTAETIKRAMDGFTSSPKVGIEHKGKPLSSGVQHLASWQTDQDQQFDGNFLPSGTWMMSLLITDPTLWQKVESGEINGLSIQGTAMVEDPSFQNQGASQEGSALREALEILFEEASKYQFSSVQANLYVPESDRVMEFGRALIPDEDLVDVTARENEPHVTVLYGLHTANPDDIREIIEGEPAFAVEVGKVRIFRQDDRDVVYVEAFSESFQRLHDKLSVLTHTSTHPTYTPHITLAYVKKGAADKHEGRADLEGTSFPVTSLMFSGRKGNRDWFSLRITQNVAKSLGISPLPYAYPAY